MKILDILKREFNAIVKNAESLSSMPDVDGEYYFRENVGNHNYLIAVPASDKYIVLNVKYVPEEHEIGPDFKIRTKPGSRATLSITSASESAYHPKRIDKENFFAIWSDLYRDADVSADVSLRSYIEDTVSHDCSLLCEIFNDERIFTVSQMTEPEKEEWNEFLDYCEK